MEHHFNVELATIYGIEEAIMVDNIYFWIKKNVANNQHFYDGRCWTFNSARAWAELFPYLNDAKIYRILNHLEDDGIIITGNYNNEKMNRTKWYAFTDKGIEKLHTQGYNIIGFSSNLQDEDFQFTKMQNGICKNEKCIIDNNNIYNNNTDTKEGDIKISPKKNIEYKKIIDCWNEVNGDRLGKVTKITNRRKIAIKHILEEHDITQEQLIKLFQTLPFADNWLYNPNKEHKNWKPDFDWWMVNTSGWFTKLIEGKVHKENPQAFSTIMQGKDAPYTPYGNNMLFWSDYEKNFLYIGPWSIGSKIADGYNDENRPNGARIMLNNARGIIIWDAQTKQWVKESKKHQDIPF